MSMSLFLNKACDALTPLYPPSVVSMIACLMMLSTALFAQQPIDDSFFEVYQGQTVDPSVSNLPCVFFQNFTGSNNTVVYLVFRKFEQGLIPYDYVVSGDMQVGTYFKTTGNFQVVGMDEDADFVTDIVHFNVTKDHCQFGYGTGQTIDPIILTDF